MLLDPPFSPVSLLMEQYQLSSMHPHRYNLVYLPRVEGRFMIAVMTGFATVHGD